MTLSLETPRLRLRPFQDADLEDFLAYRSDPEIAAYQGWKTPYIRAMAEEFVAGMKNQLPNQPGEWYQMAIEVKADGQMVGDLAYYLLKDDPRQAEIGITLAGRFHKLGYAHEAAMRLLTYLFADLELHRVRANCDVKNQNAWRSLEKLGFRREAEFIENLWFRDRWSSEYWYALLGREWRSRQLQTSPADSAPV